MELTEAVRGRRMTRSYDPDKPVSREQLDMLLRLAVRAPSAGHTQGWRFLVLDDITSRERFWAVTTEADDGQTDADGRPDRWLAGMRTAPALVVCFSDEQAYRDRYAESDKALSGRTPRDENAWPIPYWHVDTGMAAMLLLLSAQDAGLGACFFGVPGKAWPRLRAEFAVPEQLTPVGVVSLGHPATDRRSPSLRRGRKRYDDVVSYRSFERD
jgi:nitroreductase